ncbi:hypothetical protein FACS189462_3740 [Spirochaetia bacterium]|nr:hypothetical protein FACS189462_3740 [Spirochaetia bacterium]
MKTTQKWSKMLLAGMAAMVLAFGLVVVGCDDGGGGNNNSNTTSSTTDGGTTDGGTTDDGTTDDGTTDDGSGAGSGGNSDPLLLRITGISGIPEGKYIEVYIWSAPSGQSLSNSPNAFVVSAPDGTASGILSGNSLTLTFKVPYGSDSWAPTSTNFTTSGNYAIGFKVNTGGYGTWYYTGGNPLPTKYFLLQKLALSSTLTTVPFSKLKKPAS